MRETHRHFSDLPPPLLLSFGEVSEVRSTMLRFLENSVVILLLTYTVGRGQWCCGLPCGGGDKRWPVMAVGNMD